MLMQKSVYRAILVRKLLVHNQKLENQPVEKISTFILTFKIIKTPLPYYAERTSYLVSQITRKIKNQFSQYYWGTCRVLIICLKVFISMLGYHKSALNITQNHIFCLVRQNKCRYLLKCYIQEFLSIRNLIFSPKLVLDRFLESHILMLDNCLYSF